jgi:hypothetical protein
LQKSQGISDCLYWLFNCKNKLVAAPDMPIKAIFILAITAALLAGGYFFSLWAIHGFDPDFLLINKCIESGGRWNDERRECERLPAVYQPVNPEIQQLIN